MRYAYPVTLTAEDGGYTVSFEDVPEALTWGENHAAALVAAEDALATALAGYVHDRRALPVPGTPAKGRHMVALPAIVAAKLALYQAMQAQGVTKVALAARLGVTEGAVRKLVDPDHRSHIGQVDLALRTLGRTIIVTDEAA